MRQRAEFDVRLEPQFSETRAHGQLMLSAVDQEHGQFGMSAERTHDGSELDALGTCSREHQHDLARSCRARADRP